MENIFEDILRSCFIIYLKNNLIHPYRIHIGTSHIKVKIQIQTRKFHMKITNFIYICTTSQKNRNFFAVYMQVKFIILYDFSS